MIRKNHIFIILFVASVIDCNAQTDTVSVVYFNWNFLPEKNINYAYYYGIPRLINRNRYEVTFYTLTDQLVAMGEYQGKNLKTKQGVFAFYNQQKKVIISAYYRKNLVDGIYQRFYDNGKLSDSGSFYRGAYRGIWKSWYSTGQLKELKFYSHKKGHGSLENEYFSWNPNGSLEDSGYYRNNVRQGIWIEWIQNGIIKSVGEYKNGWKKGLWRYYDSKGKLLYMRRFSIFIYDDQGEYIPIGEK